MPYGFDEDLWESAKEEAKLILSRRAQDRGMITYSDLAAQIRSIALDYHDFRLNALLGEISQEEDAAGRGMMSVIVVHKLGDMQPGEGFFELASQLGRDTSDILRCWIEELHRVHAHWSI